jgi:hypothetical protein
MHGYAYAQPIFGCILGCLLLRVSDVSRVVYGVEAGRSASLDASSMPSSRCWEGAPAAARQLQMDSLDLDHGHAHQLAGSAAGCDPHRIMHTQKPTPQTPIVAEGQAGSCSSLHTWKGRTKALG